MTLAHWDEVSKTRRDFGVVRGLWSMLGDAAGTRGLGLRRIELAPGEVPTPAHMHASNEEIFFVLRGAGHSWQNGEVYEVRAGDCLVHHARGKAHTLRAGEEGLDVLAFGPREEPNAIVLPNSNTAWLLPTWVEAGTGEHPYAREPELDWTAVTDRPTTVVNLDEVEGEYGGHVKELGEAAGSRRTGLNWVSLPEGMDGAPPHCHSADEEIFVVLEGKGTLELWGKPNPEQPFPTEPAETHEIRAGHVISRPPATRISHALRGGDGGMTYLAYGTREPNDMCFYPRSNKVFFRGLGVIARLELLDYSDGEPG